MGCVKNCLIIEDREEILACMVFGSGDNSSDFHGRMIVLSGGLWTRISEMWKCWFIFNVFLFLGI